MKINWRVAIANDTKSQPLLCKLCRNTALSYQCVNVIRMKSMKSSSDALQAHLESMDVDQKSGTSPDSPSAAFMVRHCCCIAMSVHMHVPALRCTESLTFAGFLPQTPE